MKFYIDITNILEVAFFTGIPRVVSEVTLRMIDAGSDVVLLAYQPKEQCYRVVDNARYCACLRGTSADKAACYTAERLTVDELDATGTFCDINSCWHTLPNRSWLLEHLKTRNMRIVALIYDIIPIRYPQYLVPQTRLRFMSYLLAHLKYADLLLVNSQAVADDVNTLYDELQLEKKPVRVIPLGADFSVKTGGEGGEIDPIAKEIVARGPFTLTVGSLEPRKNHKVILSAYEQSLADAGLQVVFVGRKSWCTDDFFDRLEHNPHFGSGLYHLNGMNDATVQYLYRHAFLVVFASYAEGFGLPTIEALCAGVPVLASDVPIMREIGGDFCDYFPPDDAAALQKLVLHYHNDPAAYEKKRAQVATYQPPRWADTCTLMQAAFADVPVTPLAHKTIRQIAFLSARPAPFLQTIPYVEAFLPFIEEVVVCCPEKMADYLAENYRGRLKLVTITDDALLGENALPYDHATRNFFLRCLMMYRPELDEEFIMFDDDYRPLREMGEDVFFRNGRYRAYYCADNVNWKYIATSLFSYDFSMFRTLRFLREHGYATLLYSAHQPQVINKRWYQEMIARHPGIQTLGLDEWSSYFNYCATHHRDHLEVCPYITMNWPNAGSCWELGPVQETMLFENFYRENYAPGGIFEGFPRSFSGKVFQRSEEKLALVRERRARHRGSFAIRRAWTADYYARHGEQPTLAIACANDGSVRLAAPCEMTLAADWHNNLRVGVVRDSNTPANARNICLGYAIFDTAGNELLRHVVHITPRQMNTGFNIFPGLPAGTNYVLELSCGMENEPPQLRYRLPLTLREVQTGEAAEAAKAAAATVASPRKI